MIPNASMPGSGGSLQSVAMSTACISSFFFRSAAASSSPPR